MGNSTTCYKEDGTVSSDIPCGFSNLSSCCGNGWDCLSNGLCREHGTTAYSQSTCTDPTYQKCLSFCNQSQFDGYTEVSRCESNGNSWCCAGAPGQDLGGTNCCDTNLTTSLEPYPFSTLGLGQSIAGSALVSSSTPLTTSIPSDTTLTSTSSSSSSLGTSVQSTSQTSVATSTKISATPSKTLTNSPSPQPTDQSQQSSKTGIDIGVPVAIVVVLLAVLAFFIFQNRRFKQRLLHLRSQTGGDSLQQEEARPEMQERREFPVGELDLTHYELTQQDAPKHELLGNGIHELTYPGAPKHELIGDVPPK